MYYYSRRSVFAELPFQKGGTGKLPVSRFHQTSFLYHKGMVLSIVTCTFCNGTGIIHKSEFNMDSSVFCGCPVGEEKRRVVMKMVERSLKKTAYKKTA